MRTKYWQIAPQGRVRPGIGDMQKTGPYERGIRSIAKPITTTLRERGVV
jgi:hypothetical protein